MQLTSVSVLKNKNIFSVLGKFFQILVKFLGFVFGYFCLILASFSSG